MRSDIGVVIIAKNAEKNIQRCVDSCLKVTGSASNILVVDTGSNDATREILKKNDVRVVEFKGGDFAKWRNMGLANMNTKWLLYVDTDEEVTDELANEVKSAVAKDNKYSAFAIPRRNIILGRVFKHSGQYPDYQIRFFLKDRLKKWKGPLHERPEFDGELKYFSSPLLHHKHDNFFDMAEKTNVWSETEAKLMLSANHPQVNFLRLCSAVFREFVYRFIKQKSFLDGKEGMLYATYQLYSKFLSYAKLWEMQKIGK